MSGRGSIGWTTRHPYRSEWCGYVATVTYHDNMDGWLRDGRWTVDLAAPGASPVTTTIALHDPDEGPDARAFAERLMRRAKRLADAAKIQAGERKPSRGGRPYGSRNVVHLTRETLELPAGTRIRSKCGRVVLPSGGTTDQDRVTCRACLHEWSTRAR